MPPSTRSTSANTTWDEGAVDMYMHAMYEAVAHTSSRRLYGTVVTDFTHMWKLLADTYVRLVVKKLVAYPSLRLPCAVPQ